MAYQPDTCLKLLPLHLCQRRLGLGQPEGHVHGAVQLDGSGQLGAGLLPLARLGVQRAEAEVAVGQERAHAQLLGQGYGLLVGGCGRLDLRGSALRGDLAEEPQGLGLVGPLLGVAGACQGTLGKLVCLLQAAGQEIRFAEMGGPERIQAYGSRGSQLYGLLEQWQGLGEAARQRIGIAQRPSSQRGAGAERPWSGRFQASFEPAMAWGRSPWRRWRKPMPRYA